jgi:hypothetical protein
MLQLPIPPASLRIGVGPFADPDVFLQSGRETVQRARRLVALQPHERVLDIARLCSVFTHMDETGIAHYARELARVLRPRGSCPALI